MLVFYHQVPICFIEFKIMETFYPHTIGDLQCEHYDHMPPNFATSTHVPENFHLMQDPQPRVTITMNYIFHYKIS